MKSYIGFWLLLLLVLGATKTTQAQTLSIDTCFERARANYPLLKQLDVLVQSSRFTIENASKGYLPQLGVYGQATYQSEVTSLPISLPGLSVSQLSKDQYRLYGEVSQVVYDGGLISAQQKGIEAGTQAEVQRIEVELYKLKERVTQVYFGIILINEQLVQTDILEKDIRNGLAKVEAARTNGTALQSQVDVLRAELLKIAQRKTELASTRKAYLNMLGVLIQMPLTESTIIQKPAPINVREVITRPELSWYDAQQKVFDVQRGLINARNRPKLQLFMQAGYGRPALNMLNNDFTTYYIGGVRLNWSLSGLYTSSKEKQLIRLNQQGLQIQRETFLLNTGYALRQHDAELDKLKTLIQTDDELIALRQGIKTTAANQLQLGVITSNDYLREANAEDQARTNKALHEIQWLMGTYTRSFTTGF